MKFLKRENTQSDEKSFKEKAWDLQHRIEVRQKRIGKGKYGRVLKMARKPTNEEYSKTSKITFAGILQRSPVDHSTRIGRDRSHLGGNQTNPTGPGRESPKNSPGAAG